MIIKNKETIKRRVVDRGTVAAFTDGEGNKQIFLVMESMDESNKRDESSIKETSVKTAKETL